MFGGHQAVVSVDQPLLTDRAALAIGPTESGTDASPSPGEEQLGQRVTEADHETAFRRWDSM